MSNSHLFLKSGFPRAPLQNGIGRVVLQLQRITFKFCKNHGASRGIREFLETDLIDFSKNNPGIVVYVKPRRHRSPNLTVEYLNGERQVINCHNFSREEVSKWVTLLRTQSGNPTIRYRKLWHTDSPSIQGPWTPFTNRRPELNLAQFPRVFKSKQEERDESETEEHEEITEEEEIGPIWKEMYSNLVLSFIPVYCESDTLNRSTT
ncbi:unnamed protein product, partial [Timema podura]|nr:unnamed protein product [Timema podura]